MNTTILYHPNRGSPVQRGTMVCEVFHLLPNGRQFPKTLSHRSTLGPRQGRMPGGSCVGARLAALAYNWRSDPSRPGATLEWHLWGTPEALGGFCQHRCRDLMNISTRLSAPFLNGGKRITVELKRISKLYQILVFSQQPLWKKVEKNVSVNTEFTSLPSHQFLIITLFSATLTQEHPWLCGWKKKSTMYSSPRHTKKIPNLCELGRKVRHCCHHSMHRTQMENKFCEACW